MKLLGLGCVLLLALIPSAYGQSQANPVISTPFGKTHADCVHEIPSGSTVVSANVFQTPDGKTLAFPACSDPINPYPTCTGYAADASYTSSGYLGEISANWKVPSNPSNPSNTDLFYIWDGLEGGGTNGCQYVIQPLIQWGSNGLYGGKYYTMSTWFYLDMSHYYYSSAVGVTAGDSITGYAQSSGNCNSSGVCDGWTLHISDTTASTNTGFTCNEL